jgi:hypothetical protein
MAHEVVGARRTRNAPPRQLVVGKPHAQEGHQDVLLHCWEASEAEAFLTTAKAAGPQPVAFYALALDSGARKGELCGLKWTEVDLAAGRHWPTPPR